MHEYIRWQVSCLTTHTLTTDQHWPYGYRTIYLITATTCLPRCYRKVKLNPPTQEEVLWKISKFRYMHRCSAVTLHGPQGRITWKESRCWYMRKQALASQRRLTSVMLYRCRLGATPTLCSLLCHCYCEGGEVWWHECNIHTNTEKSTSLHRFC